MRDSVRIGRLGGVPIGVNWSLLAIAALLAASLAGNRLPYDAPGYSTTAYAAVGAATAVALLVAVLAHELGHALVARRAGMRVEGITLSWMGGLTRIDGDAATPGAEFAIAIIGPLVSAALGGLLWAARLFAVGHGAGALAVAALGWLAVINVVLAVFNLAPASPLDGGRVVHAIMWKLSGSRWRASRVTSAAGVGLGALIVGFGLWEVLQRQDTVAGLFTALIGWWLLAAAREEGQGAAVQHALEGITVSQLMRPVGEAPGWITVRAFLDHYGGPRPGWVWLLEGWGTPGYAGIVAGDAVAGVPMPQWDLARPLDVAVPTSAAVAAAPDDDAFAALVHAGGPRLLLVVHEGHTVGAVLPADLEAVVRSGRRPARPPWAAAHAGAR